MPKSCKIEQLGLSDTVQDLMAQGFTTRAKMTAKLNADYGADVSEATVCRFMARVRKSAHGEAYQAITDHVNKTVPDDLAALEEMEKQALTWSREAAADVTERSAAAAVEIVGELESWREQLVTQKEDPFTTVRWIIKKCLGYLAAEDRRQEQRLASMRMVHKIIETKLAKAGLLDDDTKGRIVFMQREAGKNQEGAGDPTRGNILRLVGGGDGADPEK